MQQSDNDQYAIDEERRRAMAFENYGLNRDAEPKPFDYNSLPEADKQRISGWESIRDEWADANGEIAPEQTSVDANGEIAPEQTSVDADTERLIALEKAGTENQSQFIQNATAQQLRAKYGVDSLEMTEGEQRAYDDMVYQMRQGNNATNLASINAITGVNRYDSHNTGFDHTITANGVAALMQEAKQPPAEQRQGLDNSEMILAAGAGNTPDGQLSSQIESVQPLDNLGGDNPNEINATGQDIDQAERTLSFVDNAQNYGFNAGNDSISEQNRRRLAEAREDVDDIQSLAKAA